MLTTKWQPTTRVDCERILICKGLPYWHLAVDTARKRVFESLQTAGGGRQNVNQPAPLVLRLATTTTTTTACLLPLQAGSPTDFWSTETRLCAGRWLPLLTQTWNDRRALQSIIISLDLRKRKKKRRQSNMSGRSSWNHLNFQRFQAKEQREEPTACYGCTRWEFEALGNCPIFKEESLEYASDSWRKPRNSQTC